MRKHTFTIFDENDCVCGYLFDVTRLDAQKIVSEINEETNKMHYYMESYME